MSNAMEPSPTLLRRPSRAWQRFARSRSAWIGVGIIGVLVLVAVSADVLAPYGKNETDVPLAPPSARHWLGTDQNQHDVFSRVLYGTRLSLLAGGLSMILAMLLGVPTGAAAGYFGGRIDALLMRVVDVALAFPSVLIALLVATALARGWTAIIVSVGLINVPVFARQVRATVLVMRNAEYVLASQALGGSTWHLLMGVIAPALVNPVVVLATLGLGNAILEVAGLSFLGVGGDPTEPEWGSMLNQAKNFLAASVWPALGPGAAISITILGFNLLGDGLRDALDPKLNTK